MKDFKSAEQNKLMAGLLKHVSQPMIATSADKRLLQWNLAFSKLTGYDNKELSDPIISAGLTAPEWHESETKAFDRLQRTGKSQTFQKEYIRKDGSRVPVEVLIYQFSQDEGKLLYYIGLITDITERKQLEEALQKSESHYRILVDSAIEGIVVIRDGEIKFANPVVAIGTGYSIEELQSMSLKELLCPDNEKATVESISKPVIPGTLLVVPLLKIRTKTGDIRLIESTMTSIVWDGKPANLNLLRDITEQKRLEQYLEKERQESKLIVDSAPILVFHKDNKGRFVRVNKAFAEALQMPEEEFLGKTVFDMYSDKIAQAMTDDDQEVLKSKRPKLNIIEQYESAAGLRWVHTDKIPILNKEGFPIGLIGFAQDITERKQAEEALRQSEEKYRTILEDIKEGYWETDLAGNFTSFNDAVCRILGHPQKNMKGMNYRAYTSAADVEKVYTTFNEVYRTGTPIRNMHYLIVQKDGSKRFAETSVFPKRNDKEEIIGFRGVSHDITERKNIEETLRRSEERYRTILEEIQDAYFEVDLAGNFTFGNDAFYRNVGYSPGELTGANYRATTAAEDVKRVYQGFNQVYQTGIPVNNLTYKSLRKDGSSGYVEIAVTLIRNKEGNIVGFRGVGRDVTERMQMEEALRRSEERYRTILDEMQDGYFEVDLAGNCIFANEANCRNLGYPREELIGMNYRVYTAAEDVDKLYQAFNQAYLTGQPSRAINFGIVRKDGSTGMGEISAFPVRNERGEITGFRGIGRDITEHIQIERALRQSEEKHRSILETIEESYYEVDLAGSFTFFNETLRRGFGYSREEMMGMNYKVYTPADIVDKVYQAYNHVYRTGEPLKWFPMEQIRKDGTRLVLENSVLPIKNEKGEVVGFRGIGRDITERLQLEEALRRSEERYRIILDDIKEGYFEMDLAGNYTFFNDALCRLIGYSREELMGMNYRVYVPPENTKEAFEIYNRIYRTGEPASMVDVVQIRKDGKRIFVESSAYPIRNEKDEIIGFRGVSRDVTQRLQMEEALRRSEERYRTLMEEMEEPYYEVDLAGTYTFFNDALCQKLGYSRQEMKGINYKVYTVPDDIKRVFQAYNQVYRTGVPVKWFPTEQIRKDGTRVFTENSVFPLRNKEGKIIGFRGVSRDITERKKAEEERKQLEQKAQFASRLSSVGELASGVAHEINNPLTGVIGYAHLLLARKDISRDVRHDLEIINEGAQRVAGIVKKLLAFARQTKPEQRYVNINELIGNTLDLLAYELAASNIKVSLQLTRDLPMTIADPGQLQQVFLNLIINAETEMKMANDRGKLLIKTEKINNIIRISFKDTGPGIAKENLEAIFDPFFTTREVGQGTGLGLSVCHGIVTEHNGRIWAESEPGKGATFIVELPITTEEKQLELAEPVVEEPKKITKAKILVVDDEPVIRQFISQVLGEQGHTVETVDNAASALKMVKSKRYRLILLDIKMPGMSGVELYKQFQKIAPSLTKRIVFITGDVMGKRTLDFLDKTKTPYMMKPFEARELKTQINRLLAKR
jgi:PAS domain S-box-containing protein